MTSRSLGPEWTPSTAHMMVYAQGPQTTVLVDPAYPDAWKNEPHGSQLRRLAAQAESSGGYVIVFVGDAVFKVEPNTVQNDEGRREQGIATA